LEKPAEIVLEGAEETSSYLMFPTKHWRQIRTNNPLERIMRKIRRQTPRSRSKVGDESTPPNVPAGPSVGGQ